MNENKKIYDKTYYELHKEKIKLRQKIYYETHKEEINSRQNTYYKDHKEERKIYYNSRKEYFKAYNKSTQKKRHLKHNYNISLEQYNELLINANFQCEICGSKEKLCVDHNHKTNRVRGILCLNCNFMIGISKDDIELLEKGIQYLHSKKE